MISDSDEWPVLPAFRGREPTDEETIWRMKGFLDCIKHLKNYGPVDPKYVDYLVEKTGEKYP